MLRACFATRPFRGLGSVEASMRGIHQGWAVSVLLDKAEYMSATAPSLVILTNHLAMGERSIYVAIFRWRRAELSLSVIYAAKA